MRGQVRDHGLATFVTGALTSHLSTFNSLFPIQKLSTFQNIHIKNSMFRLQVHLHVNLTHFHYRRFCRRPRSQTESQGS